MLNNLQRWIVLGIFCIIILLFAGVECYILLISIERQLDISRVTWALLGGGVLTGCGVIFRELIVSNFLKGDRVLTSRLHQFAAERSRIIEHAKRSGQTRYETRRELITNTLGLAEEILRGWIPGSHIELCVFVDPDLPLLFSYFDSNHDTFARSMAACERNPMYYIEKGYEVTKLLKHPTSHPRILSDTQKIGDGYTFTSDAQKKQIRSTTLTCLDLASPCAMVVSSNAINAFQENDDRLTSFIKFVGETVSYDLLSDNFIARIRTDKPELFIRHATREL